MAQPLDLLPARQHPELLAPPVAAALEAWPSGAATSADDIRVAQIDPELADTAAFCAAYGRSLGASANCVVVSGKRAGEVRFAACVVLATTRADVNNLVRRLLDVRKASFAAMDVATRETGMEYGGITPIGLPAEWPIYVDARVLDVDDAIVGSGLRRSKIALAGRALADVPGVRVLEGLGVAVQAPSSA